VPELPEVETIVQELRPCLKGLVPIQIICHKEKCPAYVLNQIPIKRLYQRPLQVYGKKGLPCQRCGTAIEVKLTH